MKTGSHIVHAAVALGIIALLLGLIQYLPLSTSTIYQRILIDLGHVPLFAVIAIGVLYLADTFTGGRMGLGGYGMAALTILVIGIGSEAVQSIDPDRSVSFRDLLHNSVGGSLGFMCYTVAVSKSVWSTRTKSAMAGLSILLTVLVLIAPAWTAAAYFHRFLNWPIIIGDCYRLERVFTVAYESELEQIVVPSEWRVRHHESSFLLRLRDCLDCGILLQELRRERSGHSRLCLDLTNPGETRLRLSARLGNSSMFFRSDETYEAAVTIPAASRATECLDLSRLKGPTTTAVSGEFRSGALLSDVDTPITADVLVHRIWLE